VDVYDLLAAVLEVELDLPRAELVDLEAVGQADLGGVAARVVVDVDVLGQLLPNVVVLEVDDLVPPQHLLPGPGAVHDLLPLVRVKLVDVAPLHVLLHQLALAARLQVVLVVSVLVVVELLPADPLPHRPDRLVRRPCKFDQGQPAVLLTLRRVHHHLCPSRLLLDYGLARLL
jgi:hypothetical protein